MKIALLFPGYGDQYIGMGKELYDEYRLVQEYFEEASNCVPINFVKLCFASSDAELSRLTNAYSSLFLMGVAVAALLKEQGIAPDCVAGYNNGEIAALCVAGCFSFPDGLYLIAKMCSFYEEALKTIDVEIIRITGITQQELTSICSQIHAEENALFIGIHESSTSAIVIGNSPAIAQLREALDEKSGVRIEFLSSEVGLHSELMNTVIEQSRMYLEKVDFKDTPIPVISGIDGEFITQGSELKNRFLRHINEPLHFDKVIEQLAVYETIILITPAESLAKRVKKEYPDKTIVAIAKKSDIETLRETLQIKA